MKKTYHAEMGNAINGSGNIFRVLAVAIMLFSCFGTNAVAQQKAQPLVTLEQQNTPIVNVFQSIQKQTNFSFVYNTSDINTSQLVSISVKDATLAATLDKLFTGTGIGYTIKEKHIALSKKTDKAPTQVSAGGVSGTVNDEKGTAMVGATVIIKGTSIGTAADLDGNFSLPQAKVGDVLEVSLIGYVKQNIRLASSAPLRIVLNEDSAQLDAVVVTALGIKRAEKSLTYNVQELAGDVATGVKDANFMNTLSGKVAGLQINASASGSGGSTRVVLRGVKSINGNNNALYVVDGIPLPSLRSEQTKGVYETPDGGDFEGIANLNPEDIESMSILSGATASALYGSQGANGVILITTKKGVEGGVRVNYSNTTTFSTPFVMPQFQNRYGTNLDSPSMSWGDKLETPSSYDPKDFFQTGYNETNSIGVTAGTKRNQTYVSASAVNTRGIIPNNTYDRYNFSVRNTSELVKDKLTLDLGASYMRSNNKNATVQGMYHNPLIGIYLFPLGDDIRKYQVYERYNSALGYNEQFWPLEYINGVENPYWITNREKFENTTQRYTFNATMKYDITDWISLSGRVRTDNTSMNYTRKISASSNKLFASEYGNYLNHTMTHNNVYADALLSIDKNICDIVSLQVNVGSSLMDDKHSLTGYEGHLAGLPNKFTLNNIVTSDPNTKPMQQGYHEQVQAVYGTVQVGYKGMVYVDATVRNEWASQLANTQSMSIFYPSVGVSAVISSMTDLSKAGISFLKVRTSYAEVGNPPERYITNINLGLMNGIVTSQTIAPAKYLKPELTKSFEVGINAKFLNNKIWLDATYYNTDTYNQLFLYDSPPSTGYKQKYLNAGKVNNYGLEAVVGYKNKWNDFSWSTSFNFSLNRNKIKELIPQGMIDPETGGAVNIPEVNMDFGGYRVKLQKGGSIGDFYVTGLKTDDQGNIYVDPNSNTVSIDNKTWIYAGNTEARYRMGWNNTFSYKGINLGVLIDARIGGRGVSVTQAMMDRYGVSEASALAREQGIVLSENQTLPGSGAKDFFNNTGDGTGMLSQYIYDMDNVRLRELSVGYDLPSKWFNDKLAATVSLVGRNLFMIYNKAPFDPELTASTGTYYQQFDYFMQPSVRTIGFSLRFQF